MNNGVSTTEFLLTIAALVCATAFFAMGKISADQWMQLISIVVPGYGLARGLAKINTNTNQKGDNNGVN